MQINAFVLEGSRQALDREVIDPTALAVHADLDLCVHQHVKPRAAGELAALIAAEDLQRGVLSQASLRASTQKSASILFDSRQASTLRLCQCMIATR